MTPGSSFLAVLWNRSIPVGQLYGTADADGRLDPVALRNSIIVERLPNYAAAMPSPTRQTASVVICTRDRPEALAKCLASLRLQTRPPDQVVVVDNASVGDGTRAAAMAAGVVYVREERPGLDIARNTGARRATGDIIAYTDDDVELHPDWLGRMLAAFDRDDIMAVTGLVLPAELETEAQIIFERFWSFGRGFCRIDYDNMYFMARKRRGCPAWEIGAGASMAFRRESFAAVGYFDERLDAGAAGCSGDSEYWYRLLAAGWTCRYEPASVAFHTHRRSLDGLAQQIFAYMRGHVTALFIQFERTGHWANLRRVAVSLPAWFARRGVRRVRHGPSQSDYLIAAELRGAIAGVTYYLMARRPPQEPAR